MKFVVIIPTYNEKENISRLIEALQGEFRTIGHHMNILVVDDNSPDGTADSVSAVQNKYSNVFMITGRKEGLGAAYIRGMKYAVDELEADAVMEMDADFSHSPADVRRLIAALDLGADFVIGSRYVPGGKIPTDWRIKRTLISKWGNIFAKYVAGLYRIQDCTAGFRAIRSSVIRGIDLDTLRVKGYAFQLALLHQAFTEGVVIAEVPVEFVDRTAGTTKLGVSDIIEFIINAWWIRLDSSRTFFKFALVGASGLVVNLGVFTVLVNAGLNKFISSPVAIEVSIITNFLLNNFWTFADRASSMKFHIKGLSFNIVSLLALVVSYGTFVLLSTTFPYGTPQLHQAIGIIPATLVNYLLNTYWSFKDDIEHAGVVKK